MLVAPAEQCPKPEKRNGQVPRVVVAHLGARMHYAVPVVLHRAGLLHHVFTDAYAGEGSWLRPIIQHLPAQLARRGALRRLAQRQAAIPAERVTAYNLLGLRYTLALMRCNVSGSDATRIHLGYGKAFLHKILASEVLPRATMAYGFTGTCLELLRGVEGTGMLTVVEQMQAPVRIMQALLTEEMGRWAGWQTSEPLWDEQVWSEREAEEWDLADAIVAPSEHIGCQLVHAGVAPSKIALIPYAVSLNDYNGRARWYKGNRPLRVLFVGRVGLLKGIPYLLEALLRLGPARVQARLVGLVSVRPEVLARYSRVIHTTGQVSRKEVGEHYDWADVLVLPSLSEGSATVTYEARASGLPVIATPNAGAWVRDGYDGMLVPMRDVGRLTEAIESFLQHPALVERMSAAALAAAGSYSWDSYQARLSALVQGLQQRGEVSITTCPHESI